ncbi:MAG: GNAT family N-acetyltransferase [Culicoidibacterales bacterium]
MEVKQISVEATYPLRQQVLRPNRPLSACQFPDDYQTTTYHFGIVTEAKQVVAIATFLLTDQGHQLRGVACSPEFQNQGLGSYLLRGAYDQLEAIGIEKIWCQARIRARKFYERLGFETDGVIFEVPDVGPHVTMVWVNKPQNN